jgi:hypothetical protein
MQNSPVVIPNNVLKFEALQKFLVAKVLEYSVMCGGDSKKSSFWHDAGLISPVGL